MSRGVVVTGADPDRIGRGLATVPMPRLGGVPLTVVPQERPPGLFLIRTPLTWMGGPDARDEAFAALGQATGQLVGAARAAGGRLLPTAVTLGDAPPVLGGDLHELEVLDAFEQEVLCNALRRYVPVLIALSGRGVVGTGVPVDRVGSRRLVESTEHLATRYLASTSSRHLEHVQAELRRGGLARLEQMDVAPVVYPDGTRTVLVRCLDAQASLSATRAHAVLLCALALHARRLVRDGRREGHVPQQLLEENRARAIADGMRASLGQDDAKMGRPPAGRRGEQGGHKAPPPAERPRRRVRFAARDLLTERRAEIGNIDATAAELAPLLVMIDLPGLGVPFQRADDTLRRWAAGGPAALEAKLLACLCDGGPGGTIVDELRTAHPGKISLILDSWRTALAAPPPPARGDRSGRGPSGWGKGGPPERGGRGARNGANRGGANRGGRHGGAGRGKGGDTR